MNIQVDVRINGESFTITIDSNELTVHTTVQEDEMLALELIPCATDSTVIAEAVKRGLFDDIIGEMNDSDRDKLFKDYGYVRE